MVRDLKTLYQILWEDIKDREYIVGICQRINRIAIDYDEHILLRNHFISQRYEHPEFMTEERNWVPYKANWPYWWNWEEDDNPINRKAFIQKIISTL